MLHIWTLKRLAYADELISLRVKFTGPGEYALDQDQVEVMVLVGGDGVVSRRTGGQPDAGVLVITEYGGPGGTLRGTARFWVSPSDPSLPDAMPEEFTDGVFVVQLGAPLPGWAWFPQ